MPQTRIVGLPGAARAVAASGAAVWCAVDDVLYRFDAGGTLKDETPAPTGLRSLAVHGGQLVAAGEPGLVRWLPTVGTEAASDQPPVRVARQVGPQPDVIAGGGAVWVIERGFGRVHRVTEGGALVDPGMVPNADRLAADGARLWWTSREDTLLRGGAQPVDLMLAPSERGDLVACSGSVWCSVAEGLLRVDAWSAGLGGRLPAPEGPVDHLACADGILVGGSGRRGLFRLDPRVDADVQPLTVDLGGPLKHLVATHSVAWAFPAGRDEAVLVVVRGGEDLDR